MTLSSPSFHLHLLFLDHHYLVLSSPATQAVNSVHFLFNHTAEIVGNLIYTGGFCSEKIEFLRQNHLSKSFGRRDYPFITAKIISVQFPERKKNERAVRISLQEDDR